MQDPQALLGINDKKLSPDSGIVYQKPSNYLSLLTFLFF